MAFQKTRTSGGSGRISKTEIEFWIRKCFWLSQISDDIQIVATMMESQEKTDGHGDRNGYPICNMLTLLGNN